MKTAVIRARVPETLKKEFETVIKSHGWNLSQAVRRLMDQYVIEQKELNQRHMDTLEALEDLQANRVVEGDKVMAWLDSWGTDSELDPPL